MEKIIKPKTRYTFITVKGIQTIMKDNNYDISIKKSKIGYNCILRKNSIVVWDKMFDNDIINIMGNGKYKMFRHDSERIKLFLLIRCVYNNLRGLGILPFAIPIDIDGNEIEMG